MSEDRPRYTYLGGPDLAAIVGASPYEGPYDVWLRKTERLETPDNAPMEWGRRLEGAVAQAYADRTSHGLEQGITLFHPEHPFIGGTPDFLATDDATLLLECKTAAEEQIHKADANGTPLWGEEGTDEVPLNYYVQVQHYLGLTGKTQADLAVFFLGPRRIFRIYHITFDPDLYALMLTRAVAFWHEHVETRVAPAIDLIPSDLVIDHLARRAQAGGAEMAIPADLAALALDLEDVSARKKELEEQEDTLKGKLTASMAGLGASKLKGEAFGANYSLTICGGGAGTPKTDYYKVALALAKKAGLESLPADLVAAHTKTGEPRKASLRPYFTGLRKARAAAAALSLELKQA